MVDSKKNYKHDLGVKGLSKDMDLKDQINHETDKKKKKKMQNSKKKRMNENLLHWQPSHV